MLEPSWQKLCFCTWKYTVAKDALSKTQFSGDLKKITHSQTGGSDPKKTHDSWCYFRKVLLIWGLYNIFDRGIWISYSKDEFCFNEKFWKPVFRPLVPLLSFIFPNVRPESRTFSRNLERSAEIPNVGRQSLDLWPFPFFPEFPVAHVLHFPIKPLASFKLIYVSQDKLKIDESYKKIYIKCIQSGKLDNFLFFILFFAPDYQKT